jgi:hypothetical protein
MSPAELEERISERLGLYVRDANQFASNLIRRLERQERLERLAAGKDFVFAPRRVHAPNLSELEALERELQELPTRRRLLTIKQFRVYTDALWRLKRAVAGLIDQVMRYDHGRRQERYLARVGRLFLDAPPEVVERFILNRGDRRGANLHAVALARRRSSRLSREKLSEWGRKGAHSLWAKRGKAIAPAQPKASPAESSPNEAPVPTAPA